MILPQIPNIDRTREYTQEFKGYNHNLRIAENEFYDDYNVSADNYPVLSTRKKRNRISDGFDGKVCGAIGRGEDLYYIFYTADNAKLYKKDAELLTLDATDEQRQMVFFGAYLLIYPDNMYFNTVDKTDSGRIKTPVSSTELQKVVITLQYKENDKSNYEDFNIFAALTEIPEKNGELIYDNQIVALKYRDGSCKIGYVDSHSENDTYWTEITTYDITKFRLKIDVETHLDLNPDNFKFDFSDL